MSDMPEGNRQDTMPEHAGWRKEDERQQSQEELASHCGRQRIAARSKRRQESYKSVWFGLGMFGMIGWSVAVPALAFVALGIWIDRRWPSQYSWTLMFLFVGVLLRLPQRLVLGIAQRRKFE